MALLGELSRMPASNSAKRSTERLLHYFEWLPGMVSMLPVSLNGLTGAGPFLFLRLLRLLLKIGLPTYELGCEVEQ